MEENAMIHQRIVLAYVETEDVEKSRDRQNSQFSNLPYFLCLFLVRVCPCVAGLETVPLPSGSRQNLSPSCTHMPEDIDKYSVSTETTLGRVMRLGKLPLSREADHLLGVNIMVDLLEYILLRP